MIYKIGSKGDSVRLIQQELIEAGYEIPADGIYGPRTAEATKDWQRKNKLECDGIVGPATITVLFGLKPVSGFIGEHITHCAGRSVRYIAIHYTAGSTSAPGAAFRTRNVFLKRSASTDYVVDDATIVQVNPDIRNYYCWAVGDKKNTSGGGGQLFGTACNKNTVSIEICSNLTRGATDTVPNHSGWFFTEKSVHLALRLTRYLMVMHDVPMDRVVRHYDISGKCCPGILGWNNAPSYSTSGAYIGAKSNSNKWQEFKEAIWRK